MDANRVEYPLLVQPIHVKDPKARDLETIRCSVGHAVTLTRTWHSRLPKTQDGPWQFAFKAHYQGFTYAVALWHNPSARTLPGHWLELRRMACAPDAPRYTASRMLGAMVRFFEKEYPEREKCISYQDIEVHTGTIYKASNWIPEYFSRPRRRDRSKPRIGTTRNYRSDLNSPRVASAGKIRWAYYLNQPVDHAMIKQQSRIIAAQIEKCKTITR